jgi:hypothetical protein
MVGTLTVRFAMAMIVGFSLSVSLYYGTQPGRYYAARSVLVRILSQRKVLTTPQKAV